MFTKIKNKIQFLPNLQIKLSFAVVFFVVFVVWGDMVLASFNNDSSNNKTNNLLEDRRELTLALQSIARLEQLEKRSILVLQRQMLQFHKLLDRKLSKAGTQTKKSYAAFKLQIIRIQDNLVEMQDKSHHVKTLPKSQLEMISIELGALREKIKKDLFLTLIWEETLRRRSQPSLVVIRPDRGEGADYYDKESIKFEIEALKSCFIKVVFFARIKEGQKNNIFLPIVVFPNKNYPNNHLLVRDNIIFGQKGEVTVEPPFGRDVVMVVASEKQFLDPIPLSDSIWEEESLNANKLLRNIYGSNTAELLLDIDASFFVSHPGENTSLQRTQDRGAVFLSIYEAEALQLDEQEWAMEPEGTRAFSAGPTINIHSPRMLEGTNPTIEATTPMDFFVSFEKKSVAVDMESLEVIAKKGFFSKSLTSRMKQYIKGTKLEATNLQIPSGKFRIFITVADMEGMQTSQEYRLKVSEK